MPVKISCSRRFFIILNYVILSLATLICIYPILYIVALSFSSKAAVESGQVVLWPIDFQLNTYKSVISNSAFYLAFGISVKRTVLAIIICMTVTILTAYPLSLSRHRFNARGFYVWFLLITMLFSGGMVPIYLTVYQTGLIDSIWALIIPGAVPVFNVILLQNFFKELPSEISESAFIDGAGYWTVLARILVPLSKPGLATLVLFVAVNHWNSWFEGMIYMNSSNNYPLQTYLRTIIIKIDVTAVKNIKDVTDIAPRNSKAAQIILAMIPILLVYPFLQKYFTKGIIIGSLKG